MRVELDSRDYAHLLLVLKELPQRVALKHTRIALSAWGGVVKAKAVQAVPTDTKSLQKALVVKVPNLKKLADRGKPAYVLVGARRRAVATARIKGVRKLVGTKRAASIMLRGGTTRVVRPSRYAHLAEKHKAFITPAQATGAREGMAKLTTKLREGIESEARALAN